MNSKLLTIIPKISFYAFERKSYRGNKKGQKERWRETAFNPELAPQMTVMVGNGPDQIQVPEDSSISDTLLQEQKCFGHLPLPSRTLAMTCI